MFVSRSSIKRFREEYLLDVFSAFKYLCFVLDSVDIFLYPSAPPKLREVGRRFPAFMQFKRGSENSFERAFEKKTLMNLRVT